VKLVLFDIDGTLLRTDGAGRRAMEGALLAVFGRPGDPTYRYDGKTDRQIIREQMRHAGFDEATIASRVGDVLDDYVRRLDVELARDATTSQLCAGVLPLLDAVEAHARATMGLLTGNIEPGARRKLRAVGVEFDRFRVNAFGSDHEERPQLPAVAQRRAEAFLGAPFPGDRIVIIGDTPADIHCGRALGVRAIGVATGRYGVEELAGHAPAAVFETLEDTEAVLAAILG
jgi:phosphoglycolate phosphatase-like HAD superfamily hydrolase